MDQKTLRFHQIWGTALALGIDMSAYQQAVLWHAIQQETPPFPGHAKQEAPNPERRPRNA